MVRDKEIIQQMMKDKPKENIQEVWAKNLRQAVMEQKQRKNPSPRKKLLTAMSSS